MTSLGIRQQLHSYTGSRMVHAYRHVGGIDAARRQKLQLEGQPEEQALGQLTQHTWLADEIGLAFLSA